MLQYYFSQPDSTPPFPPSNSNILWDFYSTFYKTFHLKVRKINPTFSSVGLRAYLHQLWRKTSQTHLVCNHMYVLYKTSLVQYRNKDMLEVLCSLCGEFQICLLVSVIYKWNTTKKSLVVDIICHSKWQIGLCCHHPV